MSTFNIEGLLIRGYQVAGKPLAGVLVSAARPVYINDEDSYPYSDRKTVCSRVCWGDLLPVMTSQCPPDLFDDKILARVTYSGPGILR